MTRTFRHVAAALTLIATSAAMAIAQESPVPPANGGVGANVPEIGGSGLLLGLAVLGGGMLLVASRRKRS